MNVVEKYKPYVMPFVSLLYALLASISYAFWGHRYEIENEITPIPTFLCILLFCYALPTICYSIFVLFYKYWKWASKQIWLKIFILCVIVALISIGSYHLYTYYPQLYDWKRSWSGNYWYCMSTAEEYPVNHSLAHLRWILYALHIPFIIGAVCVYVLSRPSITWIRYIYFPILICILVRFNWLSACLMIPALMVIDWALMKKYTRHNKDLFNSINLALGILYLLILLQSRRVDMQEKWK